MEKKATVKAGGLQVFSQHYLLWPKRGAIIRSPFQSVLRPFISGHEKTIPKCTADRRGGTEYKAAELQEPRNGISMSFPGIAASFHENFCQAAE